MVHPGQRLRTGSRMIFESGGHTLHAEVLGRHFHGRRTVRLWTEDGTGVRDARDTGRTADTATVPTSTSAGSTNRNASGPPCPRIVRVPRKAMNARTATASIGVA